MRSAARFALLGACVTASLPLSVWSRGVGGSPVALVTAESENELLALSLEDGRVLRRVEVAADPQTVAAAVTGPAVVVSPRSGTVTVLAWRSLRTLATLRSFRSPQIAAITPDGAFAYVTDAATGVLSALQLSTRRVVDRVFVGLGAHHLAVSPDGRRTWVALGERATTVVVLDSADPHGLRVLRRFHPATPAHDLAFAPDGLSVWITSASVPYVSVLSAASSRLLARIPAGPAPQHVAFGVRDHVFVTSGYGSAIQLVDSRTRKVLRRASTSYGSFNVATAGDVVVTSSLTSGTVIELAGSTLRRQLTTVAAPAARAVAISVW